MSIKQKSNPACSRHLESLGWGWAKFTFLGSSWHHEHTSCPLNALPAPPIPDGKALSMWHSSRYSFLFSQLEPPSQECYISSVGPESRAGSPASLCKLGDATSGVSWWTAGSPREAKMDLHSFLAWMNLVRLLTVWNAQCCFSSMSLLRMNGNKRVWFSAVLFWLQWDTVWKQLMGHFQHMWIYFCITLLFVGFAIEVEKGKYD